MTFKPTPKQVEAMTVAKNHTYTMLFGGSRSGKTFIIMCMIIKRALLIPESRHGIFRSTSISCKNTLFNLTFKEALKCVAPELYNLWVSEKEDPRIKVNSTEMTVRFNNGSVIIFGGLDDDHRLERILGQEFLTIYMNEVSEIATFKPVGHLLTRLSQRAYTSDGIKANVKFYFDCNPATKKHWSYRTFIEKMKAEKNEPLPNPEKWGSLKMNPTDNLDNLSADYMEVMSNLSDRDKKRFIDGEFGLDIENPMFLAEWIDAGYVESIDREKLVKVIVAVDPAVSATKGSDETGIVVVGVDEDGEVYILADRSMRGTTDAWSRAAEAAYDEFDADEVIAEVNNGGDLVKTQLSIHNRSMPVKLVRASVGKVVRAGPVSTLYEKGHVHHVGRFPELEEQLETFTLSYDRKKHGSPDRLDALVWGVTALGVTKRYDAKMTIGKNFFL